MTQINTKSDGNYLFPITPRGLRHDSDPPVTGQQDPNVVPPGTIGSYEKLVGFEKDNIDRLKAELPAQAREDMFEKAISGEVDMNTLFGDLSETGELNIIPNDEYAVLKEAAAAEKAGNPSPDQIAILNAARDTNGQLRATFDRFSEGSTDPRFKGFIETGGFPLATDGKVIIPSETQEKYITPKTEGPFFIDPVDRVTGLPRFGDIPGFIFEYLGGLGTQNEIQNQSEGQARIREFIVSRADGPSDPDIRDALLQTLGTDFADIFAERIYNLASVSELGVRHYLPTYTTMASSYLYEKLPGAEGFAPTDADVQRDLADLKKSQLFSNRTTFVNDMIREQLFVLYGEEKFNRLGLNEKTEDGQFVRQFVGEKFAEDLFEAMFDDLHWSQKLGAYVLEGAVIIGATRGAAAPFVFGSNIYRMGQYAYRSAKNLDIPLKFMPTKTLARMAQAEAGTDLAIDATAKARELLKNSEEFKIFSNFRINNIARAVGRDRTKANLRTDRAHYNQQIVKNTNAYNEAGDRVAEIRKSIERAKVESSNSQRVIDLQDDLRIAKENLEQASDNLRFVRAKRNNTLVRSMGIKVREFGFHPEFDLTFALMMQGGRVMMTGERDPETGFPLEPQQGLIGEGVAAFGFAVGFGLKQGFKLTGMSEKTFGIAGDRGGGAAGMAFRARSGFENIMSSTVGSTTSIFGIYRQGIAEGWLVNPTLKSIVFADQATRARFTPRQQKAISNFSNAILGMPREIQDVIFNNLDTFYRDTQNVMSVLEPLVDAGVIGMRDLSKYRQLLSAGFGETSGLAILKAYGEVYASQAENIKPGHILKAKSRFIDLVAQSEHYKERAGLLSAVAEELDIHVLNLSEKIRQEYGNSRAGADAIAILEQYSSSLKGAAQYHNTSYIDSIGRAQQEIELAIDAIAGSELPSMQEIAAIEDVLDDLLKASSRLGTLKSGVAEVPLETGMQTARADGTAALPDPNVRPTQEEIYTGAKAQVQALRGMGPPDPQAASSNIRMKTDAIMANMTRVANHTNLTRTEGAAAGELDALLKGLVATADAGRFAEVQLAYEKVGGIRNIPLDQLGTNLIKFLQQEFETVGALPGSMSFVGQLNSKAFKTKFGKVGVEFYEGIEKSATEGLRVYFSDPDRLEFFSQTLGKPIETADQAIDALKERLATYDVARLALGTDNQDVLRNMSNFQLATILINSNEVAGVNASALRLVASPKELEELKRLAGRLTRPGNERQIINLGQEIQRQVDETLQTHLQGFEGQALNDLVTARTLHRAAMQQFDPGTFGNDVRNLEAKAPGRLTGEGVETAEKSVTRRESDLLKPLVEAIVNPSPETTEIISSTVARLQATLSPVRPTGPLVVTGADGVPRIPSTAELDARVDRSMSEATFNTISQVVRVAVRNKLDTLYNVEDMRRAMKNGVLPDLSLNKGADEIIVPRGFDSLDEFFEFQNDQLRVNVDGYETPLLLFDIRDVYYANRDVGILLNSSTEFRDVHAKLIQKIIAAATADKGVAEAATNLTKDKAAKALQYAEKASTGQGFFVNVINSQDADAMNAFLRNLEADDSLDIAQKQTMLRSLFVQVMNEVGGFTAGTSRVKLPNGREVPTDTYNRPGELFFLFDDALNAGGQQQTGLNFLRLAEAAGIAPETMEVYRSLFRLGFRESAEGIIKRNKLLGTSEPSGAAGVIVPRGYSIDNAIARAFNLARDMVSPQYVTAEAIVKYAGVAKGKMVQFLISDPKAAEIINALLTENRKVLEEEAAYFVEKFTKVIARDVRPFVDEYDPRTEAQQKMYWESQGFIFDVPLSAGFPFIPNVLSPAGPSTI